MSMNCFAELFCGQWWSNGNAGAPQKAALPKIKGRTAAKRWDCAALVKERKSENANWL
jgi:hypothetical protein